MPDTARHDRIVWADIETSGLDPRQDYMLEIGLVVTDLNSEVLSATQEIIHYPGMDKIKAASVPFVQNMHTENHLWNDCINKGTTLHVAELHLMNWMEENDLAGSPMAGSSVQLDRSFIKTKMPTLHEMFHYRNIDLSSVKELMARHNPKVYAECSESDTDHRVMSCLTGTLKLHKYIVDNFLITEL